MKTMSNSYAVTALTLACAMMSSVGATAATYTIDATKSSFVVKTKVEGIASSLGHNHVIVGQKANGQVACPASSPEGCTVNVTIMTKNLRIDADSDRKR